MKFKKCDVHAFGNFMFDTLKLLHVNNKPLFGVAIDEYNKFIVKHGLKHVDICIVGSNPSVSSPDNKPFTKGTRSRKTIDSWFDNYCDFDYHIRFENIVHYKKTDNKRLTKAEINKHLPSISRRFSNREEDGQLIVAVGNDAQWALDEADITHFKMPHPSGLNHFWNDKEAGEAKIKEMMEWLKNSHYQKVRKLRNQLENPT